MHTQDNALGSCHEGFSLIEVLVTLVIIAFGVLGLINLQVKMQMNEVESYQRGQALVLLEDMASRMRVNTLLDDDDVTRVETYLTGVDGSGWLGIEGTVDCAGLADAGVSRDCTGWDTLLKGAAIDQAGADIGAMVGARGCVEQIGEDADTTQGVCRPGVYRVSVAWQGLYESATPAEACGEGEYGDKEGYRRVVSTIVQLGTPQCLPL